MGASHSWVLCRSWRAIWSPPASAASSSSQANTDLALHSYSPHVCVCVCGPDCMTVLMTVIPVGGLFFQGHSTPTPPVDRSEEMLSGPAVRYSSVVRQRWHASLLQCGAKAFEPPFRRFSEKIQLFKKCS